MTRRKNSCSKRPYSLQHECHSPPGLVSSRLFAPFDVFSGHARDPLALFPQNSASCEATCQKTRGCDQGPLSAEISYKASAARNNGFTALLRSPATVVKDGAHFLALNVSFVFSRTVARQVKLKPLLFSVYQCCRWPPSRAAGCWVQKTQLALAAQPA